MPQALQIDHEKVRAVALQIGLREAARQFGLNEDTVSAWSAREGWFRERDKQAQLVEPFIAAKIERQGVAKTVASSPSEIIEDYGKTTRLRHARAAERIAERIAALSEESADTALARMPDILSAGKHAALVMAGNRPLLTSVCV